MVGYSTPRSLGGYQGGRGPWLASDHPCGQGQAGRGWGGAGEEEPGETLSVHYSNIMPSVSLRELKMFGIKKACFYKNPLKQLIVRT